MFLEPERMWMVGLDNKSLIEGLISSKYSLQELSHLILTTTLWGRYYLLTFYKKEIWGTEGLSDLPCIPIHICRLGFIIQFLYIFVYIYLSCQRIMLNLQVQFWFYQALLLYLGIFALCILLLYCLWINGLWLLYLWRVFCHYSISLLILFHHVWPRILLFLLSFTFLSFLFLFFFLFVWFKLSISLFLYFHTFFVILLGRKIVSVV